MKLEEALEIAMEIEVYRRKLKNGKPGDFIILPDIIFDLGGQRLQLDSTKLRVLPKVH